VEIREPPDAVLLVPRVAEAPEELEEAQLEVADRVDRQCEVVGCVRPFR
jgi:hypothetical protein